MHTHIALANVLLGRNFTFGPALMVFKTMGQGKHGEKC